MSKAGGPARAVADSGRRRWLIGGAAVIVLALVIGLVIFLNQAPASTPTAAGSPSIVVPSLASASASPTRGGKHRASASPTATVSQNTMPELSPVGLDSDSDRPDGVVISLERIESVAGEARLPGEVAGPALRLTILIRNQSSRDLSLGTVVVNGYRGTKRTPLEALTSPGGDPFEGSLQPGAEARGVYLFTVAQNDRPDVTFTVDVTPGQPAAVFQGDAR